MDNELTIKNKEKINNKKILEEGKKAAMPTELYVEKTTELYELNQKQKRINKNINEKRREIEELYTNKAKDTVEGNYKRKGPGIIRQTLTADILIYSAISLIVYFFLSKLAYLERGYKSIGGEGFFLILPLFIIFNRLIDVIDKEARKKEQIKKERVLL